MPVVSLTTDWGIKDYYVGALKGALLSLSENITVIDISHFVQPFDLLHGAFIFRNAYPRFPKGTIHIIGVASQAETGAGLIAVQHKGHYFIGMNDGFFSLVFDEPPEEILALTPSGEYHNAFDMAAVVKTAIYLSNKGDFSQLGNKEENFVVKTHLRPVIENNIIKGTVIYIDYFDNVITNITKSLFDRIGKGKSFEILARRGEYVINKLCEKYSEGNRGNLVALFNNANYLEIAINQGNAAGLLGMTYGDIVRIDFK